MTVKKIRDLLPADLISGIGDACVAIPDWAFVPDEWSTAFLRGLLALAPSWEGKRIWEVGVGTGINLLVLHPRVRGAPVWYFSDFDERCVPLAVENLSRRNREQLFPLHGKWDLLTPNGGESPDADIIFACIPQVPMEMGLEVGDALAHYYCPERYPNSHLHPCGLGLVEALLQQARGVLSRRGEVVLNLGGRPGLRRLRSMFADNGYRPRVVHEEVIPQHAGTSLKALAALEGNGHEDFEFFVEPDGTSPICAYTAEARRVTDLPVYHKIYVIAGTMM